MERVDIASLTPEHLFSHHISKRKPLVITGLPTDALFQAHDKWTKTSYLRKEAGDAKVKVEPMHASKKQYGTDVERIPTTFGHFLDSLQQEDAESYPYLTTQYANDDDDGDDDDSNLATADGRLIDPLASAAFPEPVRSLLKDIPLTPNIMGNLVLQQMNLWLGKSKEGSSSGLHHDFHDNLYILLKGRKRFVLFPPEMVHFSKPYGQLEKIHDNGLIVYKSVVPVAENDGIRADGLSERDAAELRVKALEKKMEVLQQRQDDGAGEELAALEEIYDEAVDNMMDFAMDDAVQAEDGHGDDEDEDGDDFEPDEQLDALMDKIGEHIRPEASPSSSGKKRKATEEPLDRVDGKAAKLDDQDFDFDDEEEDDEDDEDDEKDIKYTPSSSSPSSLPTPTEPLSFSQIPTQELHHHLGLRSPRQTSDSLSSAPNPLIVHLNPGEMLYLPTSWWHEVTSSSTSGPAPTTHKEGKAEAETGAKGTDSDEKKKRLHDDDDDDDADIHMALNYWFHPPDRLHDFEKPYADDLVWEYLNDQVREGRECLLRRRRRSTGAAAALAPSAEN